MTGIISNMKDLLQCRLVDILFPNLTHPELIRVALYTYTKTLFLLFVQEQHYCG